MPWLYHSWNPDPYEDLTAVPEPLIGRPPTPELHFGDDVLVPNLAGWRRERLPSTPNEPYLTLAPDWICEVLSPSTEYIDRGKKLRIYAREGVAHAWLVDPLAHTLEALSLEAGRWTQLDRYEGEARVRAAPFDAIELGLGALWI